MSWYFLLIVNGVNWLKLVKARNMQRCIKFVLTNVLQILSDIGSRFWRIRSIRRIGSKTERNKERSTSNRQ